MGDNTEVNSMDCDDTKIIEGEEKQLSSDSTGSEKDEPHSACNRFGWFCFEPSWLQWINIPPWFLAVICVAVFAQSMTINGLVPVSMSSLETRFEMSSSQSGWIPASYELAGIPVLLVVGYFGSVMHKPRWISLGMLSLSLGSLLYALPHYTTGLYEWSSAVDGNLCHQEANRTDDCDDDGNSSLSDYLYVFITAAVLMAIGASPLYLLGAPFIDDCLTSDMTACYLGIFYSMSSLGPAIAFVCGGALLTIYTDFHAVDMDDIPLEPSDPRWVGAWWIGFLFAWALCLAVALPLSGYPRVMPGTEEIMKEKMAANVKKDDDDEDLDVVPFNGSCKELPGILKDLFTNLVFIFTVLAPIGDILIIVGFTVFGPKYVENMFSVSAGLAALSFGIITVPGAAGGTILGGWIVKRWSLSLEQNLWLYVWSGVAVLLLLSIFFIQCDNPYFAGVNIFEYPDAPDQQSSDLHFACNEGCQCSEDLYDPVCSEHDIIFFSPCFAGCTDMHENGDTLYYNCSCIAPHNSSAGTAVPGVCDANYCELMPLFFVMLFIAMLIMFSAGMFHLNILLRCVRGDSRSLAMSVDMVLGKCGSFPAPLLFGAAMDASCLLWSQDCGETGSCLYYDNSQMAWNVMAVCGACKLWNVLFAVLAWVAYKFENRHKNSAADSESNLVVETTVEKKADDIDDGADSDTSPRNSYGACAETPPVDGGHTNIGFENIGGATSSDSAADDNASTHL